MKALAAIICALPLTLNAAALKPGDEVSLDAIAKADFITGKAPESWQEGETYVIECWATWCGPCIAAIPHIDELFDNYEEKGLNVIGMNVWEDGRDKVAKFVEEKGDGMSYPVAYVGRGGEFEETWLKAAEVRGIPHAFVVKDGKFLFSTHPASLTEETVEALLAGGEEEKAVIERIQKASANRAALQEQMRNFMAASQADDTDAMAAALAEIEKLDPEFPQLGRMKTDMAVAAKEWDKVAAALEDAEKGREATMTAIMIAQRTDASADEPPATLLEKMAATLAESPMEDASIKAMLARVQWKAGKKEEALATAKAAAANPGRMPGEPLNAFAASFETEKPQTLEELFTALREAMTKKAPEQP